MRRNGLFYRICLLVFLLAATGCQSAEGSQPANTPEGATDLTPQVANTLVPTSSIPPSEEQVLANLAAFARLYGYIRYFHPSDQAVGLRWTRVAGNGVEAVMNAHDARELAYDLQAFFQPAAPTLRVFPVGERPEVPAELEMPEGVDDLQLVMWRYHGGPDERPESVFYAELLREPVVDCQIPEGFHDPREPYYAELGGGVAVLVPVALFSDAGGTYPHLEVELADQPDATYANDPVVQKIAGVVIVWNAMQHFFPYFDAIDTEWDQVLGEAISRAMEASDDEEYLDVLRWMSAQLQDGHSTVTTGDQTNTYCPRLILDWVEDQVVVVAADGEATDLISPGDVILGVDGEQIETVLARELALVSGATDQYRHLLALRNLLTGPNGSTMEFEVLNNSGKQSTVSLVRRDSIYLMPLNAAHPNPVTELEPGILYIDLTNFSVEAYEAALPQMLEADGIIFDLRGYPWGIFDVVVGHLIDQPVGSPQILMPVFTLPDQQQMVFEEEYWEVEPIAPKLEAEIVFLTDERAISAAETMMQIIAAYHLAEIVGEPTSGTDGNRTYFTVRGNYTFSYTALVVRNHDGSQLHGIGVQRTFYTPPTIQGIIAGFDEQIQMAIEIINQQE